MKFIKDVDSGEIFPIDDNIEQNIEVPAFMKDDFPEMKVDYSGENGANDIILDLSHQLREEKNSKTVYHKFPILKILFAFIITAVIVVCCVFGVRFANSVNFEPITIEYSDNSTTLAEVEQLEEKEDPEENKPQNDNSNEDFSIFGLNLPLFSKIVQLLPILLSVSLTVLAIRFLINLIQKGCF